MKYMNVYMTCSVKMTIPIPENSNVTELIAEAEKDREDLAATMIRDGSTSLYQVTACVVDKIEGGEI